MNYQTKHDEYDNSWYNPGAYWKRVIWYLVNAFVFNSYFFPHWHKGKASILRMFGAKIGKNIVFKPRISIKYPWYLAMGDHVWLGEKVWIENLAKVNIGNHVLLSQDVLLLCGNHNYKKSTFDLMIGEINIEDGVWLGAKTIVGPGVTCKSHSVLSVFSFANKDLEPYSIYAGNPAVRIKEREISD